MRTMIQSIQLRSVARRLLGVAWLIAISLNAPLLAGAKSQPRARQDGDGKGTRNSPHHVRHSSGSSNSSTGSHSASGKMTSSRHRHASSSRQPKQKAPTRDRVQEIQTALARDGYYHGESTGKWDSSTVDAMKRFQQDNGLNATGKLDAISLQKLGLGSDVAGLGAPRPSAPPADPTPQDKKPPSF